ncbi:MAG: DNA-binding response regulator [Bacteroidetes bacterium]|nr:response regulator transcription factor [Bacteroidia bacterium]PCH68136.1 MAG: DNA-binding response regulator [Bacteroidota bacterium]
MPANKIKILIADDHTLFREGIKQILNDVKEFVVVAEAADGDEAIEMVKTHSPDVAIIDINMPKKEGMEVTQIINDQYPGTKVLILSMHEEEDYIFNCLKHGAIGYILKDAIQEEFILAIRTVAKGMKYFDKKVIDVMTKNYVNKAKRKDKKQIIKDLPITDRELDIICCVVKGLTNVQIGEELFISPRTVETHRNNILQKLKLNSQAQLIIYAIKNNLVEI